MIRRVVPALLLAALLPGCLLSLAPAPADAPVEEAGADEGGLDPQGVAEPPEEVLPDPPVPEGTLAVRVRATAGPHGADAPVEIDRRFYGVNVADWRPRDYHPEPDPTFAAYLAALQPGVLRWPAGHTSQSYVWERAPEAADAKRVLRAAHVDSFVALARQVGAEPLLAVNEKTGTPEAAADLVRYVNVEKGYGVTWWQIGNEPDHRDGLTSGPEEYAERYLAFARAMREVDPTIRLVGGEVMTGAHVVGSNGRPDWMTPIAERAGREMDALSWHYYPLDSNQPREASGAYPTVENLLQEEARDWDPSGLSFADQVFPRLKATRDAHAPGAELWVTEMAEDSGGGGAPGIADSHAGALWTADALGRFAAHGPNAVVRFVFTSVEGHRFTLLDHELSPRPAYYVYWLMARHHGTRVVDAQSEAVERVAAHAALTEDGKLTVLLVNKDAQAHPVRLALEGFEPASARQWTLVGEGYDDRTVTLNGQTLDAANVGPGVEGEPARVGRETLLEMPPLSVRLLVLEPAR